MTSGSEGGPFLILRSVSTLVVIFLLFLVLFITLFIEKANRTSPKSFEDSPPSRKSHLKLFMDGRQFFDELQKEISSAKHHVHVSFFIFRNDELGKTILNTLKEKAKQGVQVRLLLDTVGCFRFPKKVKKELAEAGVQLAFSHRPTSKRFIKTLNERNHRKISIIDGKVGFFGGYNVGNEYLGRKAKMGHWRDYQLMVKGENVKDLQACFVYDWRQATHAQLEDASHLFPPLEAGPSQLRLIPTPDAAKLEDLFINHLEKAKDHIFIGSPYFNPSDRLMKTLIELLERGISITLLLPAKKDHPLVKPVSFHYIEPLLKKGARFFHYYLGFYHAKIFLVDGEACYIGTSNFDRRSLFLNLELNGFIYDKSFIEEVRYLTQRDLLNATECTLEDLKKRSLLDKTKTALSYPFAPLL